MREVKLYVLKSEKNGELYVGIAYDETNRLREHNAGKNRYTKGLRPWKIIHCENFPDWKSARVREKYLKSGVGKEFLKKQLASLTTVSDSQC
ncbi:MAG: GIY-YIG nuclease family protein [Bacteroidia bacterium]